MAVRFEWPGDGPHCGPLFVGGGEEIPCPLWVALCDGRGEKFEAE